MSYSKQTSKDSQHNWQIHPSFCELTFEGKACQVQMETYREEEDYRSHTSQREFVPLTVAGGIRTKVAVRFSISSETKQYQRIGEAEVWLYHEDNILLFWRCNLLAPYRVANPVEDTNLHTLWYAFERYLLGQFPQIVMFLTPAWNRPYDEKLWNRFIHLNGYIRSSPVGLPNAAFIKLPNKPEK